MLFHRHVKIHLDDDPDLQLSCVDGPVAGLLQDAEDVGEPHASQIIVRLDLLLDSLDHAEIVFFDLVHVPGYSEAPVPQFLRKVRLQHRFIHPVGVSHDPLDLFCVFPHQVQLTLKSALQEIQPLIALLMFPVPEKSFVLHDAEQGKEHAGRPDKSDAQQEVCRDKNVQRLPLQKILKRHLQTVRQEVRTERGQRCPRRICRMAVPDEQLEQGSVAQVKDRRRNDDNSRLSGRRSPKQTDQETKTEDPGSGRGRHVHDPQLLPQRHDKDRKKDDGR